MIDKWPKDFNEILFDLYCKDFEKRLEKINYENELLIDYWQKLQNRNIGMIVELWKEEDFETPQERKYAIIKSIQSYTQGIDELELELEALEKQKIDEEKND